MSWRRRVARVFWKIINPLTRGLAGFAPWWVLLETTGRRTGQRRLTPLADGVLDVGSTCTRDPGSAPWAPTP